MDPTSIWIFSALTVLFLFVIFAFPEYGINARLKVLQKKKQDEKIEDTLKYIFNQQQNGRFSSIDALSAKLNLSARKVYRLIEHMDSQGLLEHHHGEIGLSDAGEQLALQIIRAHRLWERYLADEARLPLKQLHSLADRKEHRMSTAEIDALDASLGYPSSDPHGDPIPDSTGQFRFTEKGISLTHWKSDGPGKITHLEDEPTLAYDQIVAEGLQLGQVVRILHQDRARIVLTDGENEFKLAPVVASNVFISPLPVTDQDEKSVIRLIELPNSAKAEIIRLDDRCQGFTRRRFLDLGLTPGAEIFAELDNAFKDPRAYRVRGTLIALRKDQAADIWVRPVTAE